MNALQRLDESIEESRELEAEAENLQAGGTLNRPNAFVVQRFQKRAQAWYASTLELLPRDLRERFEREWTGPQGDCGPQHFVSDPTGWGPPDTHVYDDPFLQANPLAKVYFAFPLDRCFREPLRRHRRMLGEAKHHPDIARQGRRGALVQTNLAFHDLHPNVVNAAAALFADGHYRDVILKSCIALSEMVKEKSGYKAKNDTSLIEHVFSVKSPFLRVSDDEDEQQGMMWLFKGAVMALRNPRAHNLGDGGDQDATEAFEWLVFISALMRVVDRAELVEITSDTGTAQP